MMHDMNSEDEDVDVKVQSILRQFVGNRIERLRGDVSNNNTRDTFIAALTPRYGNDVAGEIAFHLADWNSDAAFILAMHLHPEQFTAEQIQQGVEGFLCHVPNHTAAAAKLGGYPVEDIFEVGALDGATHDEG
jgi:hypothetical protein